MAGGMYPRTNHVCKRAELTTEKKPTSEERRDYWLGEVFTPGGYGWGIQLVGNEFKNICPGREEDIIRVLKGLKANQS